MKMPKSKYEFIYKDLKQKIESEEYAYQELLPSENQLVLAYNCSRNTIRRAVGRLVTDGYVQTMQGKGVRNIYRPIEQTSFTIGEIESFSDSFTIFVLIFFPFALSLFIQPVMHFFSYQEPLQYRW